jgi:chemosensory pili system protein ChpB (putative protein-glutamate methylesterase)
LITAHNAVIGLLLAADVATALAYFLQQAGYTIVVVASLEDMDARVSTENVSAWIFDAHSEAAYTRLIASGKFLLPADNAPAVADGTAFSRWADGLLRQLDAAAAEALEIAETRGLGASWHSVRAVWLLAGSAGAGVAVQQFLNGFTQPPPVAFIYAQHFDPQRQDQLHDMTPENPCFRLHVGEGVHQLARGRVIMIPPRCKVSLDRFGVLSSSRSDWGGGNTPDINELMIIMTAARLPELGVIVFSGMGDDGCDALPVADAAGARIWAQQPSTAVCDSMPRSAIATGLVHRVDAPGQLARDLEQLYTL